jgi:hypothetical protein
MLGSLASKNSGCGSPEWCTEALHIAADLGHLYVAAARCTAALHPCVRAHEMYS